MSILFARRDFWGNRLSVWVIVAMAFVAPLSFDAMRKLTLDDQPQAMLPATDLEVRATAWAREQFQIDQTIVLTWDDSSINDPRIAKIVEELGGVRNDRGEKRGGSPYVSGVVNPLDALNTMQKAGIEPREAVNRLTGTLIGAGPLRLRLTDVGRSALRKSKREIQAAAKSEFGIEMTVLDASPDLSSLVSIPALLLPGETVTSASPPAILSVNGDLSDRTSTEHDLQVIWPGLRIGSELTLAVEKWMREYVPARGVGEPLVENAFFAAGSPVAIQIHLSEAGRLDPENATNVIRSACALAGIKQGSIHLVGDLVTATTFKSEIAKTAWNTSAPLSQFHRRSPALTVALICSIVTYLFIRSIRISFVVLLVSGLAVMTSMLPISVIGRPLNTTLLCVPALVAAISILFAASFVQDRRLTLCRTSTFGLFTTLNKTAWLTILCGGIVVAGLLGMATSGLAPIREFARFAVPGVVFATIIVGLGLPSLFQSFPIQSSKFKSVDLPAWTFWGQLVTTAPSIQALSLVSLCVFAALGLSKFRFETDTVRDLSKSSVEVKDQQSIETLLGGTRAVEAVVRFDQQSQRDINVFERLVLIRDIQQKLRGLPQLSGTISLASFQPELETLPEDASFVQKTRFKKRAAAVERQLAEGALPYVRDYYRIADKPHLIGGVNGATLNDLDDELWRISISAMRTNQAENQRVLDRMNSIIQDVLKHYPGSRHRITGDISLEAQTYQVALRNLRVSHPIAVSLIVLASIVAIRKIGMMLLIQFTIVLPIVAVVGLHSWMNIPLPMGWALAAAIAVAMGLPHLIQFSTCFMEAGERGLARRDAVIESVRYRSPVIWQAGTTIGLFLLGFGFSESLTIERLALLASACIGAVMAGQMVLLPQVMAGPVGDLFMPRAKLPCAPSVAKIEDLIESTVGPANAPEVGSFPSQVSVPDPHIKPIEHATTKRRRTSNRRTSNLD